MLEKKDPSNLRNQSGICAGRSVMMSLMKRISFADEVYQKMIDLVSRLRLIINCHPWTRNWVGPNEADPTAVHGVMGHDRSERKNHLM